jgi:hypothetical protein
MNFRTLLRCARVAAGVAAVLAPASAFAQGQCAIPPARSSGLVVAITSTALGEDRITIGFELRNTTQARVYLIDALRDGSQYAHLSSGAQLSFPMSATGVETCTDVSTCLSTYARDFEQVLLCGAKR